MGMLILARALQGFGGGGILPLAQTVIADILTPRERPIFQSYSSVMFMTASILGPLAGGFLTDYLHWSFIFWIMLPLGVVALAMTDRALKLIPRNDRPHKLDVIGAAVMVVAAVLLLLALSWGGVRYPWGSFEVIALLAASALLWVAFARRLATAPEPFIPLDADPRAADRAGWSRPASSRSAPSSGSRSWCRSISNWCSASRPRAAASR